MHHQLVFTIDFWIYFFWDYQAELINLRLNSGGTCYDQLVCNGIKSEESIAISVQTRKRREAIFLRMKRVLPFVCHPPNLCWIKGRWKDDLPSLLAYTWVSMADQRRLSFHHRLAIESNRIPIDSRFLFKCPLRFHNVSRFSPLSIRLFHA